MSNFRRSVAKSAIQKLISQVNSERKYGRFWSEFWLHHVQPNAIFRLWYVLPFNGQSRRLFNFFAIAVDFKPTIGIETGTFFGTSTYLFLGVPTISKTYSIESKSEFIEIAKERFRHESYSNRIEFLLGDSKSELIKILNELDPSEERVFCYLDAHWEGDIPTLEEVRALQNWGGAWVAIVDDFFVPGEIGRGYGFDKYGEEIVGAQLFDGIPNISILVPVESSSMETGAKRGTGLIFGGSDRLDFVAKIARELNLQFLRQ